MAKNAADTSTTSLSDSKCTLCFRRSTALSTVSTSPAVSTRMPWSQAMRSHTASAPFSRSAFTMAAATSMRGSSYSWQTRQPVPALASGVLPRVKGGRPGKPAGVAGTSACM